MGITLLLLAIVDATATYAGCWMRVAEDGDSAVARRSHQMNSNDDGGCNSLRDNYIEAYKGRTMQTYRQIHEHTLTQKQNEKQEKAYSKYLSMEVNKLLDSSLIIEDNEIQS